MSQGLYRTSNPFLEQRVHQWIWKYWGMAFFFFLIQAKMSTQFCFVSKILVLSPLSSIWWRGFAIFFVSPSPCFLTPFLSLSILSESSTQGNESFFSGEHLLKPFSLPSQESGRRCLVCSRSLYDTTQMWNLWLYIYTAHGQGPD